MLLAHTSDLLNFAFLEPDEKMRLHFAPGTRYSYSGEGFNLLQFVIEQKKGRSLDLLMQDAIFAPLGMTRTGLIFRREFEADIADRFGVDGKFRAKTRRNPARGAGSMTSTADDLARFASALFAGKIVKPSTRRKMFAPVIPIRTLHQFALAADEPATSRKAPRPRPSVSPTASAGACSPALLSAPRFSRRDTATARRTT